MDETYSLTEIDTVSGVDGNMTDGIIMDQRSTGYFWFFVYDTDDDETITAEFDLIDGVTLRSYDGTSLPSGVLPWSINGCWNYNAEAVYVCAFQLKFSDPGPPWPSEEGGTGTVSIPVTIHDHAWELQDGATGNEPDQFTLVITVNDLNDPPRIVINIGTENSYSGEGAGSGGGV